MDYDKIITALLTFLSGSFAITIVNAIISRKKLSAETDNIKTTSIVDNSEKVLNMALKRLEDAESRNNELTKELEELKRTYELKIEQISTINAKLQEEISKLKIEMSSLKQDDIMKDINSYLKIILDETKCDRTSLWAYHNGEYENDNPIYKVSMIGECTTLKEVKDKYQNIPASIFKDIEKELSEKQNYSINVDDESKNYSLRQILIQNNSYSALIIRLGADRLLGVLVLSYKDKTDILVDVRQYLKKLTYLLEEYLEI